MRFLLTAAVAGLLFGAGLVLSSMTDPERVLGFLDVFGAFDPTLVFVFGGAVIVTVFSFRWILARRTPLLARQFVLPKSRAIDGELIVGAGIFGVGWGLAGYCPGPAVAGLAIASPESLWFCAAMLVGSATYGLVARMRSHQPR